MRAVETVSHYLTDYHWQWTYVVGMSAIVLSVWVKRNFGWPAALLFGYSALSAIWVWVVSENRYLPLNPYDQMALRYFAADSIAKIALIGIPMMLFSRNRFAFTTLGEIAGVVFIFVNCLGVLLQSIGGCSQLECGGIVGNPSISLGLTVCVLAAVAREWKEAWYLVALVALSAVLSKSSVAVGLFAIYSAAYWAVNYGRRWLALLLPAAMMLVGKIVVGKDLINDSDRFKVWAFMFERWRAPWNIFTGTGLGTYHVFSVNLQHTPGRAPIADGYWWNTMHNDYLQMLFECGVVGLSLFLFAYCSALVRMVKRGEWNFAISILLYGAYMLLDPALHNPLPALFGAWLFAYALRRKNTHEEYL